jgi:formate/nitrite transporter FocA (FNT family)
MTLATRKNTPKLVTVLCVFAFVVCGLNHCIADFFYLMLVVDTDILFPMVIIIIGNTIGGLLPSIGIGSSK